MVDATHMLMTCLEMKRLRLTFASVHDSYWTHASDVATMNQVASHNHHFRVSNESISLQVLRDSFVRLYEQPILENLRKSLMKRWAIHSYTRVDQPFIRYPDIAFPPVPRTGSLDLQKVKESLYFFH